MAPRRLPPADILREALSYDPESGELRWRKTRNTARVGRIAGCESQRGYRAVFCHGQQMLVHRVIWCMVTGESPALHVDHIDGDTSNNRWSNLRLATEAQTNWNRRHSGKSPYKGVTRNSRNTRWIARIRVNNKEIFLGAFLSLEDAVVARKRAESNLHGDYVRL